MTKKKSPHKPEIMQISTELFSSGEQNEADKLLWISKKDEESTLMR